MTTIVERLAQAVTERFEKFRSFEGTVFLERLPEARRQSIWTCEEDRLRNHLISISAQLIDEGQKPLNEVEIREAIDGWELTHNRIRLDGQTRTSSA